MPNFTSPQQIPYPESNDPVNIHTDMQSMAEKVNDLLTALQIPYLPLQVKNESGEQLVAGTPVYINGYLSGKPTVGKSIATDINTFPVIGLMKSVVEDTEEGVAVIVGSLVNINTDSYDAGDKLYVGENGGLTNIKPSDGSAAVAVVAYSHTTQGIVVVGPIKGGNGTWGSLKQGI